MPIPTRPAAACAVAIAALLAIAGCGSSSSSVRPAAGSGQSLHPRPSDCPTPAASPQQFPPGASSDLPRPAFATSPSELPVSVHGVTLLRFTTAMSLSNAVAFLLQHYPQAGYRLIQGDSEGHEADAPFVKGQLHGTTRLTGTGACSTTWLVAVTTGNATLDKIPQLQPHDGDSADSGDGG